MIYSGAVHEFAHGRFMTVCIYKFPFESVCRIWDIFLSEGIKIVFRVALAILKINEEALLRESFEGVLNLIKLGPAASRNLHCRSTRERI